MVVVVALVVLVGAGRTVLVAVVVATPDGAPAGSPARGVVVAGTNSVPPSPPTHAEAATHTTATRRREERIAAGVYGRGATGTRTVECRAVPRDASTPEHVARQYADGSRLAARHYLHATFGVATEPFLRWLFEREAPAPGERVLEVGCGRGDLWVENADRLPAGAHVVLTDASAGMAAEAAPRVAPLGLAVAVADARRLPFATAGCDRVLANHMLYHVPDLDVGLAEIARVLRPGGRLHASTNGERHMRQLDDYRAAPRWSLPFTLENGEERLAKHFAPVQVERLPSRLEITEAAPAVDYLASYTDLDGEARSRIGAAIQREIDRHGAFLVERDVGLFTAVKA